MFFVFYFDRFVSTTSLKFTRIIFNFLTLNCNLRFAYFYVVFNLPLSEIKLASRTVDLNFIVKFHNNSIRLFELVRGFTVGT